MAWSTRPAQSSGRIRIFVLLIFATLTLFSNPSEARPEPLTNSALTKEPFHPDSLAATALLNVSVNPCDDFCKFTGGEDQAVDLRNDQASTRKLRGIFAEESPADEPKSLTYVKNLYRACVNQDRAKEPDLNSSREIVKLLDGWPTIYSDSPFAEDATWRNLQIKLSKMGFEGFFKTFYLNQSNAIVLAPMDRVFPNINYSNTDFNREMREALNLDRQLPEFQIENHTLTNHRDLNFLVNALNFTESEVMSLFPPHFSFDRNSLHLPEKNINQLVKLLNESSNTAVFNHALMLLIANITSFYNNPLKRQEQCINFISARFPEAQEILYVRKYFHKNTKNHVNELIRNLKNSLKEQCEEFNNEVSTETVRTYANCSFIDHVSISLGYPDEFFDDEKITEYYKNLEIHPNNFLQGLLNYTRYKINSKDTKSFDFQKSLREYVAPDSIISSYQSSPNIPAEYLYTYFEEDMPKYRIYGEFVPLLGQMISSQVSGISHDDNDRGLAETLMFNIPRVLRYSSVSTWATKGAYSLYKNWLKTNGQEPSPPGLTNYTSEQLFWISRSHFRCNGDEYNQPISDYKNLRSDFECSE